MRSILLFFILCTTLNSYSQDYGWTKDGGIGGTMSTGNFRGYGVGANMEPKYFLNDNFSIGGRLDIAYLFAGNIVGASENVEFLHSIRGAFLAKGEYYIGQGLVRPFIGIMSGLYIQVNKADAEDHYTYGMNFGSDEAYAFGFSPEVGVRFDNGIRVHASYHIIPQVGTLDMGAYQGQGDLEIIEVSRNYLTIQVSFSWGLFF